MTLESYEAVRSSNLDRFSNLPDEVAHEIMSVLSFKDLTRVGCLSKRFKNLQLSAPFISFDVHEGKNVGKMLDSFSKFMTQRGDNKIQKFAFTLYVGGRTYKAFYEKLLELRAWITSATRCNVEKLELSNKVYPSCDALFSLSSLFLCESLRSLVVHANCVIIGEVSSFTSMSNLAFLSLATVSVIDESFWKWISCCCKSLHTLSLMDIHGSKNIIIESSSLKTFSINLFCGDGDCCNISIRGNRLENITIGCTSKQESVQIYAPNVKGFNWSGTFSSHQNFGEMRCLNEGRISCYGEVTKSATLVDVLYSMRWVKILEINDRTMKALSKDGFTFAPLYEVRCLKMTCLLTDDLVPGLICLLKRTPGLRSLCIYSYRDTWTTAALSDSSRFDMEWWKLQKLAIVDHLKNIAIPMCKGSSVFEFARYILKQALNLERMDIFCNPSQYDGVMKLPNEMISNGTVIFHQVQTTTQYFEMISNTVKLFYK